MKDYIRFSAIVPIYNTAKYLESCIESMLTQTIPFYEIILINDGSTDDSGGICRKYCEKYENIHLYEQPNQGQGIAKNKGMQLASGDYVVFIDSDDEISESMNEIINQNLMQNHVDVLYFSSEIKDDIGGHSSNNAYIRKKSICDKIMTGIDFFTNTYLDNYIVSPCCAVYHRTFLESENITFPQGIVYEDNPFFLNVIMRAQQVSCIEDKLYIRRYRENSTTTSEMNAKKCCDYMAAQYEMWNILKVSAIPDLDHEVIKNYLLSQIIMIRSMLTQYGKVVGQECNYAEHFISEWNDFILEQELLWDDLCILMFLKQIWEKNECSKSSSAIEFFRKIESLFCILLKGKLSQLSLNEEKRIGIYGVGKHTQVMLEWYKKLIGPIRADVYFIVSKNKEEFGKNKKTYYCNEIPHDTDAIIISSKIYAEEMICMLKKNQIDFCEIITIYNRNEKFDLVIT